MTDSVISTQTIFCESIRSEQSGQTTLVGIYTDNINFGQPPVGDDGNPSKPILGALSVYTRTRLPLNMPIAGPLTIRFRSPSGQIIFENELDVAALENYAKEARDAGNEYVLILTQVEASPFPVLEEGRFKVCAEYDGTDHFSGALNCKFN